MVYSNWKRSSPKLFANCPFDPTAFGSHGAIGIGGRDHGLRSDDQIPGLGPIGEFRNTTDDVCNAGDLSGFCDSRQIQVAHPAQPDDLDHRDVSGDFPRWRRALGWIVSFGTGDTGGVARRYSFV